MRKSIRIKLISIFVVLFIFGMLLTGVLSYFMLDDAIIEDKTNSIKRDAVTLEALLGRMSNQQDFELLEFYLNIFSRNLNYLVFVTDKEGRIIIAAPNIDSIDGLEDNLDYDDGIYSFKYKEQYEILPSDTDFKQEIGDYYGLFSNMDDVPWLSIRKSLYVNEAVVGSLNIFSPTPELLKIKKSLYEVFAIASLIAMALSAVLVYLYSSWFIIPIRKLNHASTEVAKGNYTEKISVKAKDEIGQLADNFNEMTKALARLEKSRKDFIANASHELRSPMTSIRGFIDAILDGVVPEDKMNEYLTLVRDEVTRLSSLVTNLLDTAKFDSSELELHLQTFNINRVLRTTISRMEPLIMEKKLKIHAKYEMKDLMVNADKEMIERVCLNLIQNAIKYTSENGDIYLTTKKRKNKVYVNVSDNGQGIKPEEINLIWDRFYKSDQSRGEDNLGVGLGLSIVKKIIEAHGEEITVESEPHVKTSFTFSLKAV